MSDRIINVIDKDNVVVTEQVTRVVEVTSGIKGDEGDSAYVVATNNGFVGTVSQWLASLVGAKGDKGDTGNNGTNGTNGTDGVDGANGIDGASAYEVALGDGFVGTIGQWLTSLIGPKGDKGDKGDTGDTGAPGADGSGSVDSVTGTLPVSVTAGTTPVVSMAQATSSADGYLSSADWTVFSSKKAGSYVPTWSEVTSKPTFATVATSGDYNDLSNKPSAYSLPTASITILGGVKVDGTSITISSDVISTSPTAIGLGNVENKSSATIRSEITSTNVTTALGFTPLSDSYAPTWASLTGTVPTFNQNTTGTAANVTGIVAGANGGTGVANTGKTLTLGGNHVNSGAFASTFTFTGTTTVTFPTSGTLVTLTGAETLSNKTLTAPILGTPASGNLRNCTKNGTDGLGYLGIPQNSQSAAYTLVLADAGKHLLHPSADTTARIFTIPANASVAFPIGTAVTFVNQNAGGVITISITTDVMRLAGAGTTGSRTLAANGIATALKITATEWIISGVGLT